MLSSYSGELLIEASKRRSAGRSPCSSSYSPGTETISYGALARATCGAWAEMMTSACIALSNILSPTTGSVILCVSATWLVMGSYMIVMADMMVPVLEWIIPGITVFVGGYWAFRLWVIWDEYAICCFSVR